MRQPKAKHDYDIRWQGQSIGNIYATSKADALRQFRSSRNTSSAIKLTAVKRKNPAKFDRCVADVKRSLAKAGRAGNAFAICTASRKNAPDFRLYKKAQAADERYQRALEKEYGGRAGDMRYSYSQTAKIKKLGEAKKKADAAWLKSMRSNPAEKWNPLLPLDIFTATLTPNVLGSIEKEREKIARGFRHKNPSSGYRGKSVRELETMRAYANARAYDDDWLVRDRGRRDVEAIDKALKTARKREAKKANAGDYSFRKSKKRMKGAGLYDEMVLRRHSGGDKVKRIPKQFRKHPGVKSNPANPVPAAEERYQSFHGRPSERLVKVRTTLHTHDVLAGIGDLRKLRIKSKNGHWKVTVKFSKPYPILSMNEAATQLYIEGGDQSVSLKDFGIKTAHEKEVLGEVTDVWYFTTKDHLRPEDGGTAVYHHKFGRIKPTMIYDVPNELLEFAGGGYTIPDEGIDQ
jgi:hypothetical protein